MKKWGLFALVVLTTYLFACRHEKVVVEDQISLERLLNLRSPTGNSSAYVMPESDDFANIPNQDPKNPLNKAKVELGRMLFFETGIGLTPKYPVSKQAYSCSSCHVPEKGFTAGRFQGIADGAIGFGEHGEGREKSPLYHGSEVDAQGARPLPTINLAFVTNALWAGTFGSFGTNVGTEYAWHQDTLVEINFKGLEGLEANNMRALIVHRQMMDKAIADSLGYTEMFDAAFPEIPVSERYSIKTTAFAIAAYFRTIYTNQAPFQRWLKGDKTAMNDAEIRGATLFFGKAGCYRCHNSPSLNAMQFEAVGARNLYQSGFVVFRTDVTDKRNFGRGGFTGKAEDMHKFKVPQLYNLKDVGFYFHGASKRSLREVVEYFNIGIPEDPDLQPSQVSTRFHPLNLTATEVDDLVEFLENGLFDPNLNRYKPGFVMSGNCFPNNDPQSKLDLGCN